MNTPTISAPLSNPTAVQFQHYSSSLQSTKLITTTGKKICFVNFQFITSDQDHIDYLNDEITKGLKCISKGKLMTAEEANPMNALKKAFIKEYVEEQKQLAAKEAMGESKDMGNTATGAATQAVGALSSKQTTTKVR